MVPGTVNISQLTFMDRDCIITDGDMPVIYFSLEHGTRTVPPWIEEFGDEQNALLYCFFVASVPRGIRKL